MAEQRRQGRYPAELWDRAVRLVFEAEKHTGSQWEAICSVAEKLGPAVRWAGERPSAGFARRARRSTALRERSHTDTVIGCSVRSTTVRSSVSSVVKSIWPRSLAPNASAVLTAS